MFTQIAAFVALVLLMFCYGYGVRESVESYPEEKKNKIEEFVKTILCFGFFLALSVLGVVTFSGT